MNLVALFSFFFALISIFLTFYYFHNSDSKKRALCYFTKQSLEKNKTYLVIYNKSDFYLTKENVYTDILITNDSNGVKISSHVILTPFKDSKVEYSQESKHIKMDIDFIAPKQFTIIEINGNRNNYKLKGVLKDFFLDKKNYHKLKRSGLYAFAISFCVTYIFCLIIVQSMLIDDIGQERFGPLMKINMGVTIIISVFLSEQIKKLLYDEKAFCAIKRVIKKNEKEKKKEKRKLKYEELKQSYIQRFNSIIESIKKSNIYRRAHDYLSKKVRHKSNSSM